MGGVSFDLEATPLDADGYDGALLWRGECSDDDIGSSGGVSWFDLHVEGGAGVDVYSRRKAKNRFLLGVVAEEAFQHLH